MASQTTWLLIIIITSSTLLCSVEAISFATLFLLTQARNLPQQNPQPQYHQQYAPTWTEWSLWTMCSQTVGAGVRVRSRDCKNGPCDRLRGDDYELQMCNNPGSRSMEQNPDYLRMCTEDPTMSTTMSCKLYRENPSIAYNIYHSAGCVFEVLGDPDRLSENNNLVLGRAPNTREGEIGLEFLFEDNLKVTDIKGGNTGREEENPLVQPVLTALTARNCGDQCDAAVVLASGISRFGPGAPSTVSALIRILNTNAFLNGDIRAIQSRYDLCVANCLLLSQQSPYATFLSGPPQYNDQNLAVNLAETGEQTGPRGKRSILTPPKPQQDAVSGSEERNLLMDLITSQRPDVNSKIAQKERSHFLKEMDNSDYDVDTVSNDVFDTMQNTPMLGKSAISNKAPKRDDIDVGPITPNSQPRINITFDTSQSAHIRHRRQVVAEANQFTTLCHDREEVSSDPHVLNLDDSQAELFFFEDKQQRFIRKKCVGPRLANDLFIPPQAVRHVQTRTDALCKQGYLKRFGVIIQIDPEGEYAFDDGQRFSVGIRPFKLESHCSLSVTRRRG